MEREQNVTRLTKALTFEAVRRALATRQALAAQYTDYWWEIWRSIESIYDTGKLAAPREETGAGLNCPAAPPHWKGAKVFGVVAGEPHRPKIVPIDPEPVTPELLQSIAPATPRETLRITATCVKRHCRHWAADQPGAQGDGVRTLAQRIITQFETRRPADDDLPPCAISSTCRWLAQHGGDACRVCPQI
jgi:hypothetical protein